MRMEELSDNRYVKGTDTVERYLLNLVQEYFKTSNVAATTSKEYIIKKAVERMKEEISFDSIGVLSITLPDGEERTGAVNITLEDLNGEPLISPKLSAFNVDFGTEPGTACEGNDPRLSDARKPLEHEHNVSDIVGLEGIISTLTGKAERIGDLLHEHKNLSVLNMLVYTGNRTKIDLIELETLEDRVKNIANEVQNEFAKYEQNVNTKVTEVNQKVTEVRQEVKALSDALVMTNTQYLNEAKEYVNTKTDDLKTFIQEKLDELALESELNELKQVINNCYTLVGKMEIPFNSLFNTFSEGPVYIASLPISQSILQELSNRNEILENCKIEIVMSYMENGKRTYKDLPYVIMSGYVFDGSFNVGTNYINKSIEAIIKISRSDTIPQNIKDCNVIYSVYSKYNALI